MDALFGDILGIMRQVQRKEYTDRLDSYRGKHIIKVITGARRCGKSTLLKMYSEKLRTEGIDESRIVFINLEDYDNVDLLDPAKLHGHIRQRKAETGMTYVFLDEIQNVDSFQKVVDSLFLDESLDIYMTGSNAYFLSGELATLLSGRYVTIDMLPLSLLVVFLTMRASLQNPASDTEAGFFFHHLPEQAGKSVIFVHFCI